MNVTISTDASFSNRFKRGSYAFWIVSNLGKVQRSGMLRGHVESSLIAEMKSIYNAFHLLSKSTWMPQVKVIYINTDCMNAIHLFNNDKKRIKAFRLRGNKDAYDVANRFRTVKKRYFDHVKVEFRHVKAHTHTDTPRHYTNDWCDKECKKHISKLYEDNPNPPDTPLLCGPSFTVQVRSALQA